MSSKLESDVCFRRPGYVHMLLRAKSAGRIAMSFAGGRLTRAPRGTVHWTACTLAPPGKYD